MNSRHSPHDPSLLLHHCWCLSLLLSLRLPEITCGPSNLQPIDVQHQVSWKPFSGSCPQYSCHTLAFNLPHSPSELASHMQKGTRSLSRDNHKLTLCWALSECLHRAESQTRDLPLLPSPLPPLPPCAPQTFPCWGSKFTYYNLAALFLMFLCKILIFIDYNVYFTFQF